jgi:hypothetical protein
LHTSPSARRPAGNSLIVRKIVNVYWTVTITATKMLISILLAIMVISSIRLISVIVTLELFR